MFKSNGGFTLVELIVVIAILAILAGVAVPAYSAYISNANEAADDQLLDAYNTAIASALAMEGLNGTNADTYFAYDNATKKLSGKDINGESVTGLGNDVWENFVEFYGLADTAVEEVIDVKAYTTLTFTNGVLSGSAN